MKNSFYFWFHIFVILIIWSSIFWVNWMIILLFICLYYVQLLVFGNCLLTIRQFNSKNKYASVYAFTLKKLGFKINQKKVSNFVDFVLPWIILLLAVIWQNLISKYL